MFSRVRYLAIFNLNVSYFSYILCKVVIQFGNEIFAYVSLKYLDVDNYYEVEI